ncbi:MAG: hypothetical protein JSV63_00630 [Candidatus Aenigmatarchaeota archaeon]|nr:MAG: hypothetical protein JSV63_00630 [Candidatus Aenigmarchaeota archaeon]
MKHALPALLSLFLVVFISGCTIPYFPTPAPATGNGVVIVDFEPELNTLYSEESTNFLVKIKNMGSFIADGEVRMDLGEWGEECMTRQTKEFTDLLAPDPERGTEGEERVFSWRCSAPGIEEGLHIPYNPRAVVKYAYKTITSQSVTLLPTAELIALRNSGNSLPSEMESASQSPVSIDVQVNAPIRLREDTNSVEFPVTIKVNNVGGGIVEGSIVRMDIDVEGLDVLHTQECYDNGEAMNLWRGTSQTITCKMSANNVPAMTQARIVVTAEYDYSVMATTHIEVIGDVGVDRLPF